MACRVGMSTNPQERMEYWARVEGHTHSQILAVGLTYDEAHVRERAEAQAREMHAIWWWAESARRSLVRLHRLELSCWRGNRAPSPGRAESQRDHEALGNPGAGRTIMKLIVPSMRTSRRELLRFVAYGLPAWLGFCHLRERNEPSPVRLAADSKAKVVGGVNFQGGLKGDLSCR